MNTKAPKVKKLPLEEGQRFTDNERKFGTYKLEHLEWANVYRLKNGRDSYVFRWDSKNQKFWLGSTDSMHKCVKHLKISAKSFDERELKKYLDIEENRKPNEFHPMIERTHIHTRHDLW